ncbi:hypothetical protein FAIPA1_380013 [Frankia sp. AiPs1]
MVVPRLLQLSADPPGLMFLMTPGGTGLILPCVDLATGGVAREPGAAACAVEVIAKATEAMSVIVRGTRSRFTLRKILTIPSACYSK